MILFRCVFFSLTMMLAKAARREGLRDDDLDYDDLVEHPGHAALHVTRLHRVDMGSKLELESEMDASHDANTGTAQADGSASSRFHRVSAGQLEHLQEHHRVSLDASLHNAPSGLLHTSIQQGMAVTRLHNLASQYVGQVGVGSALASSDCSPGASAECPRDVESWVWLVLDTGSTNIWVSSDLCTSCGQSGRTRYNHTRSLTYAPAPHGLQLAVQFGTGKVEGRQGVDEVHIGPFTVQNQTLGLIEREEGSVFEDLPFDGILGLAFQDMSAGGVPSFFENIIGQKVLAHNEFAFYLSPHRSSANAVFWGGVDPAFYRGKIEYFPVVQPHYWAIELVSFKIGDTDLLRSEDDPGREVRRHSPESLPRSFLSTTEFKAIVDTGTTFMSAETALFRNIMDRLETVPCERITEETHPLIAFTLRNAGGELRDFELNSFQYMTTNSKADTPTCAPAFMKIDIPRAYGPAMVLGEVFLRQYYAVFDRGDGSSANARVGLAPSVHENAAEHIGELTRAQPS